MEGFVEITEEELVEQINCKGADELCNEYQSVALSSIMLASLYNNNKSNKHVALFLTKYENTPSRVLVAISKDWADEQVLIRLAKHQRTQPEILQKLAVSEFISVRKSVACNKGLTPQTAAVLVNDPNCVVRSMLAENVVQFQTTQLQLASDEHPCVVTSLLAHKKCSDQARKLIFEHESIFVKISLAANVSLSDDRLLELADSNDENTQNALFLRYNLPEKVQESLCFSKHKQIALRAIKRKHLDDDELLGWARNEDSQYRTLIAGRGNLPEIIQDLLAEDSCTNVLTTLANNRSLCDSAANIIVENCADEEVITALASNPAISEKIVTKLCQIDDQTVHQVLALRNDLTNRHLDILINEKREFELVYILALRGIEFVDLNKDITRILVGSELPTIRAFATNSKTLDQRDIPRLVYDKYEPVVINLIRNKNTNNATLQHLCNDKNENVARLAAEELHKRENLKTEDSEEEVGLLKKVLQAIKG